MNNIEYVRILDSNKFSIKEKKLLFIGILFNTICDKTIFKKNNDLKQYIKLYEKILDIESYRDYLYDSRTLLGSRLVRDFINSDDDFRIKECFKVHIKFIEESEEFRRINSKIKDKNKATFTINNLLKDMINKDRRHE